MLDRVLARKVSRTVEKFNRLVPWHKLPTWLGLANPAELGAMRVENLFDAREVCMSSAPAQGAAPTPSRVVDGSYNDLAGPSMPAGTHFARDARVAPVQTNLMTPHPRVVSARLLARRVFIPAESLNVLAAAWIQFITRDWFRRADGAATEPYAFSRASSLLFPRTRGDLASRPQASGISPLTDDIAPWWDAARAHVEPHSFLRTLQDGKLSLTSPWRVDLANSGAMGFVTDTNWAPTDMLHTLFALEHNAICDALASAYPSWNDEALFRRAVLINSALRAKIHAVEWTPALQTQASTTTATASRHWGEFGARLTKLDGTRHEGEPSTDYSHGPDRPLLLASSVEFVSVCRMHSLVPDDLTLHTLHGHGAMRRCSLLDLLGDSGAQLVDALEMDDLLYSLGIAQAGAPRLHNYPNLLRNLLREDGARMDLAATDIMRDRERGAQRYTAFRRRFELSIPRAFDELTDDPCWARQLSEVYDDIDQVDLLTGMLAEPTPYGNAFGDTAMRVFIQMASRRLNADRSLTTDFTDEVYSPVGMRWIRENGMMSVLLRHFPRLAPALAHTKNAFSPWNALSMS